MWWLIPSLGGSLVAFPNFGEDEINKSDLGPNIRAAVAAPGPADSLSARAARRARRARAYGSTPLARFLALFGAIESRARALTSAIGPVT